MRDNSSSHTDVLTLVSIVEGSNEPSVPRGQFETGPIEPMSTKYPQLPTRTPPVFKSLTNTIYDAGQKVGNQNSENILKFLTQDALNQLLQLCLIDLEALE